MKLPKRVPQHISETASFRLFSSKVPNNWIVRDASERDYGIDCYLELVNDNDELSGELALIQLKSRQSISWTKQDTFILHKVDITTSNYWYQFPVPVFIFLADLAEEKIYFKSVKHVIKKDFSEFKKETKFNYLFERIDEFEGRDGIFAFKDSYRKERYRQQFENELLFFLSNFQQFKDFRLEHSNRDFHLGIEASDLIYFEAMHRNYRFLCEYFNIENPIPSLKDIKRNSRKNFGNKHHYELYEHDLSEWGEKFEKLTIGIIKKMKVILHDERSYWLSVNPTIYKYIIHIKDDGTPPYW